MIQIRNLFFIAILGFYLQLDAKTRESFTAFSSRIHLPQGFLYIGWEGDFPRGAEKGSFLLQELYFHPQKGWEEWIFQGEILPDSERSYLLHPKSCQIRANLDFGKKKGLLRRFDCEHLRLLFSIGQDEIWVLEENPSGIVKQVSFPNPIPGSGQPRALGFSLPEGGEGIWGFHLNGLGSETPNSVWNPTTKKWTPDSLQEFPPGKDRVYQWKRSFSN